MRNAWISLVLVTLPFERGVVAGAPLGVRPTMIVDDASPLGVFDVSADGRRLIYYAESGGIAVLRDGVMTMLPLQPKRSVNFPTSIRISRRNETVAIGYGSTWHWPAELWLYEPATGAFTMLLETERYESPERPPDLPPGGPTGFHFGGFRVGGWDQRGDLIVALGGNPALESDQTVIAIQPSGGGRTTVGSARWGEVIVVSAEPDDGGIHAVHPEVGLPKVVRAGRREAPRRLGRPEGIEGQWNVIPGTTRVVVAQEAAGGIRFGALLEGGGMRWGPPVQVEGLEPYKAKVQNGFRVAEKGSAIFFAVRNRIYRVATDILDPR